MRIHSAFAMMSLCAETALAQSSFPSHVPARATLTVQSPEQTRPEYTGKVSWQAYFQPGKDAHPLGLRGDAVFTGARLKIALQLRYEPANERYVLVIFCDWLSDSARFQSLVPELSFRTADGTSHIKKLPALKIGKQNFLGIMSEKEMAPQEQDVAHLLSTLTALELSFLQDTGNKPESTPWRLVIEKGDADAGSFNRVATEWTAAKKQRGQAPAASSLDPNPASVKYQPYEGKWHASPKQCWDAKRPATNGNSVYVQVTVDKDGMLIGEPALENPRDTPEYKAAAGQVLARVKACQPYKLADPKPRQQMRFSFADDRDPSYKPPTVAEAAPTSTTVAPRAIAASKKSLPAKFITISDVPVCKDFEISKNLSELALNRHTKAYVAMFKAHLADGRCREIPKDSIVYVTRLTDFGNLTEMKLENGAVAYGPDMMLEPVPLKSFPAFAAKVQTCWKPKPRGPSVIARVTYGRDGKIQEKQLYGVPLSQGGMMSPGSLMAIDAHMAAMTAVNNCQPMPMPPNQKGPLTVEYKFTPDGVK